MRETRVIFLLVIFIALSKIHFCLGQPQVQFADLVLLNGKIITLEEAMPEAQALAARGDIIVAVGSNEQMKRFVSSETRVIDLRGQLAIPGLIESHGHFMSMGQAKMRLDLTMAKNWDEIVAMVAEAVKNATPGEWILGRGWHQEKWDKIPQPNVEGLPYHFDLSKVSPDNPVFLTHASGHAGYANAKAMELAGITKSTPDPDGGEIVRDEYGNPIGAFREEAQGLIAMAMRDYQHARTAEQRFADQVKTFDLAVQECLSHGITSFHDAGSSFETIDFFKQMVDQGRMGVRLYVMISENNQRLAQKLTQYRLINYGDKRLTVRAIKRLIDGALGAHGAWLLEPYNSLPTSVGLNTEPLDQMEQTARIAIENEFQLCTHAIGDRGNRETLNIYEAAFRSHPDKKDLRWRIEHAQHLHPDDIPRFGQLGIIAAMQGIHCTSDGPWVIKRLGEQRAREGAYVWQTLIQSGAIIANGTDVPVEPIDPIANFYALVTRKMKNGEAFFPEQKMTRLQALRSYTINGAYAAFEENIKGTLAPGKLADITVLSKDILTIPEDEILQTEVTYTIVGGKVRYQK
ncbi:MAG: amidohydrolase [candidate division KSB1 bacterium]|nr:amidohydrolase [candidate division KSB1 bacterium]MDZ7398958.1 amidohydrolase [candidate division KSB1 bacterium]